MLWHPKQLSLASSKCSKMKTRFFVSNLIYSISPILIFSMLRPDFIIVYDGVSQANRCLGIPEVRSENGSNETTTKLHHTCNVPDPLEPALFSLLFNFFRMIICWIYIISLYLNVGNILEMVIYFLIFSYMRR